MKIERPVFIIGCPRSGTTLLYTILRSSPELWSAPGESHFAWTKFLPNKQDRNFSVVLSEDDFKDSDRRYLLNQYHKWTAKGSRLRGLLTQWFHLKKYKNQLMFILYCRGLILFTYKWITNLNYRIIDKTPSNTYKVSYIAKAFPDARFIYITRDASTNISSLIDGWRSDERFPFKMRGFYDYNQQINIKGYNGKVWKFTNPPGWQEYLNKSLEEVCAFQWLSAHEYTQNSFAKLDPARIKQVKYEDLITNPASVVKDLCEFIDISYDAAIASNTQNLPIVSTVTNPDPNKWLKNKSLIDNIAREVGSMQKQLGYSTRNPVSQSRLD